MGAGASGRPRYLTAFRRANVMSSASAWLVNRDGALFLELPAIRAVPALLPANQTLLDGA